jgi:hypothetical protein
VSGAIAQVSILGESSWTPSSERAVNPMKRFDELKARQVSREIVLEQGVFEQTPSILAGCVASIARMRWPAHPVTATTMQENTTSLPMSSFPAHHNIRSLQLFSEVLRFILDRLAAGLDIFAYALDGVAPGEHAKKTSHEHRCQQLYENSLDHFRSPFLT